MQISAPARNDRQAGFTLVELLVVLVILGLLSGAVIIALPDGAGRLGGEATRFAARIDAAQDAAVISARPMALRITDIGYGFDVRENGGWRPLQVRPFNDQLWEEGTRAVIGSGAARVVLDSTGTSDPASVALFRGEQRIVVAIPGDGTVHVER